ncbi:pentapeptide repeat-containing protein [candidate division KSB1 bacterium]|nr:pentapeptide repeat-containing protein [candidate division KSB1 bacterium]
MANPEHLAKLKEGVKAWNDWKKAQGDNFVADLSEANLEKRELPGINLKNANLQKAKLYYANLQDANLFEANLREAYLGFTNLQKAVLMSAFLQGAFLNANNFHEANLKFAKLQKADLHGSNLQEAKLDYTDLQEAKLRFTKLQKAHLMSANLQGAVLRETNLQDANLFKANLQKADLGGTNLQKADLRFSDLTNANFTNIKIHKTKLHNIKIDEQIHPVLNDGSDTIIFHWRDKLLNWSRLRAIGQFPLFGVSWVALGFSIFVLSNVDLINTELMEFIDNPIPIPGRMVWLLISSILLVIGSTLYKTVCPARVQEFSETQWVEQHRHPRLLYIAEKLRRRWVQWPTLITTVSGGLIALWLVLERLIKVIVYLLTTH